MTSPQDGRSPIVSPSRSPRLEPGSRPSAEALPATGFRPDLEDLRAFVAVAREGGVSRAAAQLHLSQPAISLRLQRLAEGLGLALFRRRPHGLALTDDGEALLPVAERALAGVADIGRLAATRRQDISGGLAIGTILDPAFIRLGSFLKELNGLAPRLQPELRQGMSGSVERQLLHGRLAVGFLLGPPSRFGLGADPAGDADEDRQPEPRIDNLLRVPLTRFRYRVIAPAGWRDRVEGLDWTGLADLPWVGTPTDSVHHRLLSDVYRPLGLQPRRVALVDQEASMLDLVRSGICLALARDSIAIAESQQSGLVVADQVAIECVLGFACLASRRDEPGIERAWQAITRIWSIRAG